MSSFRQPDARDSITLAFEKVGRPIVNDVDWAELLKILKDAGVVATPRDERVMAAVWLRLGNGRLFTHVELRAGYFEEIQRPRPGETEDDGSARRERALRAEAAKSKEAKKASARAADPKDRFDYSAHWGHVDESDEDSERDETMEAARRYVENHRRRGNAKFEAGEHLAAVTQYTAALAKYSEQLSLIAKKKTDSKKGEAVARKSLPADEDLAKVLGNRSAVLVKMVETADAVTPPPSKIDPALRLPSFEADPPLDPYKLVQACYPSKFDRVALLRTALQDADRAAALAPTHAKHHFRRATVLRTLGRGKEAHAALSTAFPLAPEDHGLCLALADLNADFAVAYDEVAQTKKAIQRGRHMLRCLFGRRYEAMKNVDLTHSKHGEFMIKWTGGINAHQREAHVWSVLKKVGKMTEELYGPRLLKLYPNGGDLLKRKAEELHVEVVTLMATIGSVEFLHPGAFAEKEWMPNLFFAFMWTDTDRADHEVRAGKKERIKQKEERLAPGTWGRNKLETVLGRNETVLFDFDCDDAFQVPLIRVATRLFRHQLIYSVCCSLIHEVTDDKNHPCDPTAKGELVSEWKHHGLYVERKEYNYNPPKKPPQRT